MPNQGNRTEKKPRRKGSGSVFYDTPRKRWVGQLDITGASGRRQRKTFVATSESAARQRLNEARKAQERGERISTQRELTVGKHLELWLATGKASQLSAGTRRSYESAVKILIDEFGGKRLPDLTMEDCNGLWSRLEKAGNEATYINKIRACMRSALTQAKKNPRNNLVTNVAADSDPRAVQRKEKAHLTAEQVKCILESSKHDRLHCYWSIGILLGTRPSESFGLTWSSVDLDAGTVDITRQVVREKGKGWTLDELKTEASVRSLDLPAQLVGKLRKHKARQAAERLAAGEKWQDHDLVFTTLIGTPLHHQDINREWHKLRRECSIPTMPPYRLRHSAGDLLLAQGVPMDEVAAFLGHSSTYTTRRYYARYSKPHKKSWATAMEAVLS